MVVGIAQSLLLLVVVFIFCYLGFNAFTDLEDLSAGIINTAIIFIISVAFNNVSQEDSDSKARRPLSPHHSTLSLSACMTHSAWQG